MDQGSGGHTDRRGGRRLYSCRADIQWRKVYRSFCRIYREVRRGVYAGYVRGRFLSISHAGGKMGVLVKTQYDKPISATGHASVTEAL